MEWHLEQQATQLKTGNWVMCDNSGEINLLTDCLELHILIFVSHRLAIKKNWNHSARMTKIGYFAPWDSSELMVF